MRFDKRLIHFVQNEPPPRMLRRFFISAVLLGAIYFFYTEGKPMGFFSKEAPTINQDEWASVLPGSWKDETTGGIAIIRADGSYEQEGREKITEPIEGAPFKGSVSIDVSAKTKGNWSLKENQLSFTILTVDRLVIHDYTIESPELVQQHGAEALKKLTAKARQQLDPRMRAKLRNMTVTHTLTSVQQDRIVSRDPKGKESVSSRVSPAVP
jgi:hypothetical protein